MNRLPLIIAGFPGVGKSEAGRRLPGKVIDLESSDFHWIVQPDGKKVAHPEWPDNYIRAIKALALETEGLKNYKDLEFICISTHAEVLSRLQDDCIGFFVAYTTATKETMIQRYIDRGNTPEFVEKLFTNYDAWIENIKAHDEWHKLVIDENAFLGDFLALDDAWDIIMDSIADDNMTINFNVVNPKNDSAV